MMYDVDVGLSEPYVHVPSNIKHFDRHKMAHLQYMHGMGNARFNAPLGRPYNTSKQRANLRSNAYTRGNRSMQYGYRGFGSHQTSRANTNNIFYEFSNYIRIVNERTNDPLWNVPESVIFDRCCEYFSRPMCLFGACKDEETVKREAEEEEVEAKLIAVVHTHTHTHIQGQEQEHTHKQQQQQGDTNVGNGTGISTSTFSANNAASKQSKQSSKQHNKVVPVVPMNVHVQHKRTGSGSKHGRKTLFREPNPLFVAIFDVHDTYDKVWDRRNSLSLTHTHTHTHSLSL